MCQDIQREPDFYMTMTESILGSDIHPCWVQKYIWMDNVKTYQAEVRPYFRTFDLQGGDIHPNLVLLRPRCPRLRLFINMIPERRKKISYFLRHLWSPWGVYILGYVKDIPADQLHISKDCITISIGQIFFTKEDARESLRIFYDIIGDDLRSLNMLNCDLPFCKNGRCQKDDYKFIEYTSKGAVLNCKCGDKYLYDYPELMQIMDNGRTKPYMHKNLLEEWHEDV